MFRALQANGRVSLFNARAAMDKAGEQMLIAQAETDAPPDATTTVVKTQIDSNDDELVAEVRAGDETAFEILFQRHRRRVGFAAGKFLRRREQIEEIIQATFVKAYFALDSYSGGNEKSFSAWLARIATNLALDELRRVKRRPEKLESDLTEEEAHWLNSQLQAGGNARTVEDAIIDFDLADKLLARLDPEDRMVLTLLNSEEASTAEVSVLTGWSASKIKMRAHRARAALRQALKRFL